MSYILDALKKSEQERRRGEMPEITRFETSENNSKSQRQYLPYVIVALLSLNAVALVIWAPWKSDDNEAATASSYQESINQVSDVAPVTQQKIQKPATISDVPKGRHSPGFTAKAEKARQPSIDNTDAKDSVASPAPIKKVSQPAVAEPQVAVAKPVKELEPEVIKPRVQQPEPYVAPVQTSYLPQLQELPASIQSRVPDMSFSSHMYSSQPRYRSIIINGRRLKEGQFLNDDIQVREITDKGVILGLDGTVFEVDVLGQWVN